MRSRLTVVCGFLLFSAMAATPAQAGPWSAFVAWLSDLDPKSGGIGVEMRLFCPPKVKDPSVDIFTCTPRDRDAEITQKYQIKSSAAFLLGTLNDNGGTIFVAPVLPVIIEKELERNVSVGLGVGFIHVGGTLQGGVTNWLLQVGRVTVDIPKTGFGFRTELNVIPKGYPAGAFASDSPATGTEFVVGLSVVYLK